MFAFVFKASPIPPNEQFWPLKCTMRSRASISDTSAFESGRARMNLGNPEGAVFATSMLLV